MTEWYESYHRRGKLTAEEARELRSVLGINRELEEIPFRELVPEDTWFHELLDIQHESESPSPFFFLAGCAVFSNIIGRQVMIDRGTHVLGLDTSALLISPAGRGRRSTACDFVVYEIGEPAGVSTIADSFTYEAMGEGLCQAAGATPTRANPRVTGARALIYAGEMSVLLGKGSYADSIIPKLTDIIGKTSRFNWQTVKRGKIEFVSPAVNALFTSAPDWLVDNIPPVVFGGGMLSRFLICVRENPEQIVTWGKEIDPEKKQELILKLKELGAQKGVFHKPSREVLEWYDEWYQKHMKDTLYGELPDERMAPYYSRKHDHLLRLAAILELASGSTRLSFSITRFQQALKILNWLEIDIPKAYQNMALSPLAAVQRQICTILERAGGSMETKKLARKMIKQLPMKDQFDAVMRSLMQLEIIREVAVGGTRSYMLNRNLD